MKIIYTAHLLFRLKIRRIPFDLPRDIFNKAKEHFYDNLTKHYVAVSLIGFEGKHREMALSYDKKDDLIEIITIHPIKSYQKLSRVKSGRWKKI